MNVETVRMSSKGQVVIPQDVREALNADTGTVFAVEQSEDTVILKKINTPSKEELLKELGRISKEGRKRLERIGIKESDIAEIALRRRHSK